MKVLIVGGASRYEKFMPEEVSQRGVELVFAPRDSSNEERLALAGDAQVLLADAISRVDGDLIARMPNLKLIHSEGVAFDAIDLDAARQRGIYVCNNKGCNADAVAEQAVMLMLMLLRQGLEGDRAVRTGRQIQYKERAMVEGIRELGSCSVGLIGLGSIGQAVSRRLRSFGCSVYYYTPNRRPLEVEMALEVSYLPLDKLAARCDIVSLHCVLSDQTRHLVDAPFLAKMRPDALLINTGRGELVDNQALRAALVEGRIAGAGLDTIYPEPTPADHPLVDLPEGVRERVVYSPHLGGITTDSFRRAHRHMWDNVFALMDGEALDCVVNGL